MNTIINLTRSTFNYFGFNKNIKVENKINDESSNILNHQCALGSENATKLLNRAKDINIEDDYGLTPLISACMSGNIYLVKNILWRNASINYITKSEFTALSAACHQGHLKIVELLLDEFADPNLKEQYAFPLMLSLVSGHNEIFKLLVERGADIKIKMKETKDSNLLMIACIKGNFEIVEFLLKKGIDINEKNRCGDDVFSLCYSFNQDIINLLNRYKPKPKPKANTKTSIRQLILEEDISSNIKPSAHDDICPITLNNFDDNVVYFKCEKCNKHVSLDGMKQILKNNQGEKINCMFCRGCDGFTGPYKFVQQDI